MNKQLLKNFKCRYNKLYVFILENNTSLKCEGWGSYLKFVNKFWNYYVVDYKNINCDETTTVILTKNATI